MRSGGQNGGGNGEWKGGNTAGALEMRSRNPRGGPFEENGSIGFQSKKFSLWQTLQAARGCSFTWVLGRTQRKRYPVSAAKTIGVPKRGSNGEAVWHVRYRYLGPSSLCTLDFESCTAAVDAPTRALPGKTNPPHRHRPAPEWWSRLSRALHRRISGHPNSFDARSLFCLSFHIGARFHILTQCSVGVRRGADGGYRPAQQRLR